MATFELNGIDVTDEFEAVIDGNIATCTNLTTDTCQLFSEVLIRISYIMSVRFGHCPTGYLREGAGQIAS